MVVRLFGNANTPLEVLRAAVGTISPSALPPHIQHIWSPVLPDVFDLHAAQKCKEAREKSQAKLDMRQERALGRSQRVEIDVNDARLCAAHKAIMPSWEQATRAHADLFLVGL
jgi:hypothetical protein